MAFSELGAVQSTLSSHGSLLPNPTSLASKARTRPELPSTEALLWPLTKSSHMPLPKPISSLEWWFASGSAQGILLGLSAGGGARAHGRKWHMGCSPVGDGLRHLVHLGHVGPLRYCTTLLIKRESSLIFSLYTSIPSMQLCPACVVKAEGAYHNRNLSVLRASACTHSQCDAACFWTGSLPAALAAVHTCKHAHTGLIQLWLYSDSHKCNAP